jgi:hypothetical protein
MYANKKQFAIVIATALIKTFNENKAECNCDSYKMKLTKDVEIDTSKEHLNSVLDIVAAIMYSSGFFTYHTITIKGKRKLQVVHMIQMMTPEEKETQITSKLIDA